MSGKLKETRIRIKSVSSTQQITKAMKMVSAAKLRRAQERIIQMRPYSQKLNEIAANIVTAAQGEVKIKLAQVREVKNVLIIVVTSDRGLAGAFNINIIKEALKLIKDKYSTQAASGNLTLLCVGKKGMEYFKKRGYNVISDYTTLLSNLTFDNSVTVTDFVMKAFEEGKFDEVQLVYSQFKNAASQIFKAEQFLPVPKAEKGKDDDAKRKTNFIFEPDVEQIVDFLIPKILKTQFFKVLLDVNASEHGARMTAMDKASENANELIKALRIAYNGARQAAITTELTEIVSGANALAEG
jgi:F-type H+-transporting ATPase subunit gamma